MIAIPLTQNRVALVDDSDAAALNAWKWTYLPNGRGGYAVRWETRDGKRHIVYMHRQLMSAAAEQVVDHADSDGLNNQRANLRLCDVSRNGANKPAPARTIPYRGVYPNKLGRSQPYKAQIKAQRRVYHLGAFLSQEEAARVYDRAALHFFGSFARLNFPDQADATRALPLPRTIARRLVTQLALPLDDQVDDWIEDLSPPPAPAKMDWLEMNILQDWRRSRAAVLPVVDLSALDDLL